MQLIRLIFLQFVKLMSFLGIFNKGSTRVTIALCLSLVVLGILVVPQIAPIYNWDYHVDEGYWVAVGHYYFQKFFVERDLSYETWKEPRFGIASTRHPTIGKYIIGAAVYLWGEGSRYKIIPGYDLQPFKWDALVDVRPPVKTLLAARSIVVWITILSCVVLFLLIRELSGSWFIGLLTALFFMFDPLVLLIGRFVLLDMPALFFSLIMLLTALYLYRAISKNNWQRVLLWSIALGISSGLAMSIKLNTLLVLIVCLFWGIVNLCWFYVECYLMTCNTSGHQFTVIFKGLKQIPNQMRTNFKPVVWTTTASFLSLLIMVAIFWGSNPFLYSNPIHNTKHIFELGKIVGTYENIPDEQLLETAGERLQNLLIMGGRRYAVIKYWFKSLWMDSFFIILGCLLYVYWIFRKQSTIPMKLNYCLFGFWGVIAVAGVWYWVPFDWPRYYLPLQPIWSFVEALGVIAILLGIKHFFILLKSKLLPASW